MVEDLDAEHDRSTVAARVDPVGAPYDPARNRELVRGLIAAAMTVLFVAVIAVLMADALLGRDLDYITKLAAVVLTPVAGLLGAAVGFYYGENSRRR